MARKVANADGNFTASIWGTCDSASELDSETGSTALTAADQNSSTFTPAAVAIDAILVKLASRASGSPTNTITITLRNNTTATDIASVTLNVSDLQVCDTTNREGGWYLFKLGATHTPNGADTYVIRARLSATTTAVSLWRDGTAANWSRLLRTTTTSAPAAADRLVVTKEWTSAGTGTARSVTMDNTAATVFGTSSGLTTTNWVNSAMIIGNGGTLTWGNTAATNYLLTLVGSVVVYAAGTYICGGSGSEIPRDSTAILEFQQNTSGDSRFGCLNLSTVSVRGLSRTSGKNVVQCLLNTDEAAAQTTLGVDTDTGWKSGDEIAIASTTRTNTEAELRTLSADANAADMTVTAGLTNAHKGTASENLQAEIILLSRNVVIRTNNVAEFTAIEVQNTATAFFSWVRCTNHGFAAGIGTLDTTTGSVTYEFCSFDAWGTTAPLRTLSNSANNFTVSNCVGYTTAAGNYVNIAATAGTSWTINLCTCVRSGNAAQFILSDIGGTFTNIRASGCSAQGMSLTESSVAIVGTVNNLVAHSNGNVGIAITAAIQNKTISNLLIFRNNSLGLTLTCPSSVPMYAAIVDGLISFGNTTTNVQLAQLNGTLTLNAPIIAGDTSFSTATGLEISSSTGMTGILYVLGGTIGGGGGTKTTHTTRDVFFNSNTAINQATFIGTSLLSATEFAGETVPHVGSFYKIQNPDGAIANTRAYYTKVGQITYETTTVHGTVSQKLTPIETLGSRLFSAPVRVAVNNADTVTMSVWARKDGSYNGSIEPRLVVRANPAIGINADTVLDTLSVGANTWEQLSGTTAAVTGKGVLEFAVEVNGTAGNAFVDTFEAT